MVVMMAREATGEVVTEVPQEEAALAMSHRRGRGAAAAAAQTAGEAAWRVGLGTPVGWG